MSVRMHAHLSNYGFSYLFIYLYFYIYSNWFGIMVEHATWWVSPGLLRNSNICEWLYMLYEPWWMLCSQGRKEKCL